jgi:predicted HicB family RNase H-like nuclease
MAGAQREWPRFMLRVAPEMKKWLEDQAERNFASQNSEILRCIQERMDRTAALEARRKTATGKAA